MTKHRFLIAIDGIEVAVDHQTDHFARYDHSESTDPAGRREPIPISPTGYRSHFAHASVVAEAGGPEASAKAYGLVVLKGRDARPTDVEDEAVEPARDGRFSHFDRGQAPSAGPVACSRGPLRSRPCGTG